MDTIASRKTHILDHAFSPRSIAVVGASDQPVSFGFHFLQHLINYKFPGIIYPVNPNKQSILGIKCYPRLVSIPGDIEYVICCVPTEKVLSLLDECAEKKVKIVHMFTARLGETGRPDAIEMEKRIIKKSQKLGIRIIGPNCMGVYNPASGIAFGYDFPSEPGSIGLVFQSGGAACVIIQYGALLGLRFSKAVSYGNGLDLDESDIIEYFIADNQTDVIAAYFEGVRNGPRFMKMLKKAAASKPVIAIKGGRSSSGMKAALSHTAAITGSHNLWKIAFKQAGVIEVGNFDEMLGILVLFSKLPPVYGRRVAIMGGGGGKAVVAADLAEEAGLIVPALSDEIRSKLKGIVPELWDWLGNPVDLSIWGDDVIAVSKMPGILAESPDYDFIVIQVSDDNPMEGDMWVSLVKWNVDMIIDAFKKHDKPVIAVLSGGKPGSAVMQSIRWQTLAKQRTRLVEAGVPVFDTMQEAVSALNKYIGYWQNRNR